MLKVLIFWTILATSSGSSLVLEHLPEKVTVPFTKQLKLVCSVQDGEIVPVRGKSNVTETEDNISGLNSLAIYRVGQDDNRTYLAVITSFVPAKQIGNDTRIQVQGDLSENATKRGYLQVTLDHPDHEDDGRYVCRASIIHNLVLTASHDVTASVVFQDPTIETIVNKVYELESENIARIKELDALRTENVNLNTKVVKLNAENVKLHTEDLKLNAEDLKLHTEDLKLHTEDVELNTALQHEVNKVNDLKSENIARKKELDALRTENVKQNTNIRKLDTALQNARHIEYGSYDCDDKSKIKKYNYIQFAKPYNTPPRVFVTGTSSNSHRSDQVSYYTAVSSTTTRGFRLLCGLRDETRFGYLDVSWLSLPSL